MPVVAHGARTTRRYASTLYWAQDSKVRSDGPGGILLVAGADCTVY
jgi:hypothetical protein